MSTAALMETTMASAMTFLPRVQNLGKPLALVRSRKNLDPFSSLARALSRTFFKASARELILTS